MELICGFEKFGRGLGLAGCLVHFVDFFGHKAVVSLCVNPRWSRVDTIVLCVFVCVPCDPSETANVTTKPSRRNTNPLEIYTSMFEGCVVSFFSVCNNPHPQQHPGFCA